MSISALVSVKVGQLKGGRMQSINVLDTNMNRISKIKRSVQREEFVDVYRVRLDNRRYDLMRYEGELCIVVRGAPSLSMKKAKRGQFSASCKGARY